jgi:hypothetical protein
VALFFSAMRNSLFSNRKALRVSGVALDHLLNGENRVSADIGGSTVWFESSAPLVPSPEAFASIALLPATFEYGALEVDEPVDPVFRSNLPKIGKIVRNWWGKPPPILHLKSRRPRVSKDKAALFFTGGVDSFFSLQRRRHEISLLINIQGFDIALHDTQRLKAATDLIHNIADELGLPVVEVRTNLKEHPVFQTVHWAITHLSAIASVAHVLSGRVGRVFVASSDVPPPWGSHQDLDPLWSSSELSLINDGWQFARLDKVKALAGWDLAAKNVKVCWENLADSLNCGRCEKCVRSQVMFRCAGYSGHMPSFPHGSLIEGINNIPYVDGVLFKQWNEMQASSEGEMRQAIANLIGRSDPTRAY